MKPRSPTRSSAGIFAGSYAAEIALEMRRTERATTRPAHIDARPVFHLCHRRRRGADAAYRVRRDGQVRREIELSAARSIIDAPCRAVFRDGALWNNPSPGHTPIIDRKRCVMLNLLYAKTFLTVIGEGGFAPRRAN